MVDSYTRTIDGKLFLFSPVYENDETYYQVTYNARTFDMHINEDTGEFEITTEVPDYFKDLEADLSRIILNHDA